MTKSLTTVRLLLLTVLVVMMTSLPVFLLGAAFFDIGPEFELGPFDLGVLTATFFLTAAATSAPLGRWVQRVGWRRALRVNAVLSGVVLVLFGSVANSVTTFTALMVLAAATYGMSNPAANLALADHTNPRWQATVFGLKHAGIPGATLVAGLAVPLIVLDLGWRRAYMTAAILSLLVLILIPAGSPHPRNRPQGTENSRGTATLSRRALLALAGGAAVASLGAIALGTFGVSASLDSGLSESDAGWLQFAGSSTSILARLAVGYVTDIRRGRGFGAIAVMAGVGAVVFALLTLASGAFFVGLVVAAFATAWGWPGLMTYTVVNANRSSVAESSAIPQAGVFVGAGVGPIALGALIDSISFDAAWLTVAASMTAAAWLVSFVGRRTAVGTA